MRQPTRSGDEPAVGLGELLAIIPPGAEVHSLSDRAYFLLRDRIISLRLRPGAPIDETRLMRELAVGRTPIREALKRLSQESLVTIVPYRGIFVGEINITDLAKISEVRAELEPLVTRLAIERATEEQRAAAADLLEDLRALEARLDWRELIRIDQRIHHLIYVSAHNRFLAETLRHYLDLALRLWFLALERLTGLDRVLGEHRALLRAMLDREPDRGAAVARRHVVGFERSVRRVL